MGLGSVLSRSRGLILRLFLLSAISLPTFCIAKEPSVAIQFDPKVPNEKVAAIWLGYLMARATYHEEHKLPIPESGVIFPSFDEEVYARIAAAQIYQELKEKDKDLHDTYWETLSQVKTKGFMNAYVWTYLQSSNWPESQRPNNLSAFQNWSRSNLKNHKATTYGSLAVER
jgi:hypothetical protein